MSEHTQASELVTTRNCIAQVLDAHSPAGYFATRDGHRECYCSQSWRDGEGSLIDHLADVLTDAGLRFPPGERGNGSDR